MRRSRELVADAARASRLPLPHRALVLEAELRDRAGAPLEAARLYNLALMGRRERQRASQRSTSVSPIFPASRLADTLSAIRYWRLVADREPGTGAPRRRPSTGRAFSGRRSGTSRGATRGYDAVVSRFPEGTYTAQARDRLRALALRPVWNENPSAGGSRGSPSWDAGPAQRSLEAGALLVENARDAETAVPLLEGALARELSDSLRAKGSYYLGTARLMRSDGAAGARGGC